MNEPKKSEIEAAARKKWPKLTGIQINHRKHTISITFGGAIKHPRDFELAGTSHCQLLAQIESLPQNAAA